MREPLRKMFAWLLVIVVLVERGSSPRPRPQLTRQNAIQEAGLSRNPFAGVKEFFGSDRAGYDKLVSDFNEYIRKGNEGTDDEKGEAETEAAKIVKVLGAVDKNVKNFKSKDALKTMKAIMDVCAELAALNPKTAPFAIVFSTVSMVLGFADKSKSETEQLKEFIRQTIWDNEAEKKKNQVATWLLENEEAVKKLDGMIQKEKDHISLITLEGIKDALTGEDTSRYGNAELTSLWTTVDKNIELSHQNLNEKTPANGLKVYNLIDAFVKGATKRDTTLFKVRNEICFLVQNRKCSDWPGRMERRCKQAKCGQEQNDLVAVCNNLDVKYEYDRANTYCRIGNYLERISVSRSPVLIHHHPIGWNDKSQRIHDFLMEHCSSPPSYQQFWISQPKKTYMLQHVEIPHLHIEPEDDGKLNDRLELEDSGCLKNYAVELEKINDPTNRETHGYFTLKQPQYEGSDGSAWNTMRHWRYYVPPARLTSQSYWLRLEKRLTPNQVSRMIKTNSSNNANEYLFIVLEQEVPDEARCNIGMKPVITIVPKLVRYVAQEEDMFLSYKTKIGEKRIEAYETYGKYSEFYLHDCQGKADCPGCHAVSHPLKTVDPSSSAVIGTVDGRDCPWTTDWDLVLSSGKY